MSERTSGFYFACQTNMPYTGGSTDTGTSISAAAVCLVSTSRYRQKDDKLSSDGGLDDSFCDNKTGATTLIPALIDIKGNKMDRG